MKKSYIDKATGKKVNIMDTVKGLKLEIDYWLSHLYEAMQDNNIEAKAKAKVELIRARAELNNIVGE
jgi:hypothetical protein